MLKHMLITNNVTLAKVAADAGVDRLFVDLEIHGKEARQGHLSSVISRHDWDDVRKVRDAAPNTQLLVRINPLHDGTDEEVRQSIELGADFVMLPMYRDAAAVRHVCRAASGRIGVIPLLETSAALNCAREVAATPGVIEIFVGLNDLHLDLGLAFMFEPLANGLIDRLVADVRQLGTPFGFGGVARVGEGLVPGEMVLGEHLRLGSSSVILSRTFHRLDQGEQAALEQFVTELQKLRDAEATLRNRSPDEIERHRATFVAKVKVAAQTLRDNVSVR